MIVDITRLRSGILRQIDFSFDYQFSLDELKGTDISKLDDLKVKGVATLNALKEVNLDIDISGTMIIPCAVTLKPVEYPFNVNVNGSIDEIQVDFDKNIKKNENTLDIFPIIWENILMEVPMRVLSDEASSFEAKGDGWSYSKDHEEHENSELSKLKDLL